MLPIDISKIRALMFVFVARNGNCFVTAPKGGNIVKAACGTPPGGSAHRW